ncbi:MAG: polysaccharide biosynthesis C-terminal domain-containing protein [Clostridia bacterium]|nr:polysaccharide biosynthesis C-terminal domain-containing protein [Clostridia bacterium]MBQ8924715.1 polysaccharide biosynthesis C-terminal domain-containing protein [Clostridia bacterium]
MEGSGLPGSTLTERRLEMRDIMRRVGKMAVPAFMSSLLVYLMNLLNYVILAAFTDYTSIASYGIVSSYTNLSAGFFVPLSLGTGYLLERTRKENDPYKTQNVINSVSLFSLLIGIGIAIFGFFIAPAYVWQVVTPEEIKDATTMFLRFFSFTYVPILYFSITTTVLIHLGERTAPIMAEVSALALHASFSYIFVGLFDWDIRGIAISAIIAQIIGSLINTHQLVQQMRKFMARPPVRIDWSVIRELAKEERTVVFTAVLGGVFVIFLQFFIDELGVRTIAGFALFFLFQDLLFIPIHALRTPARTLSAEYYEQGGNNSLLQVINPMIILSILYSILLIPVTRLIGPPIFMLFSHDPEVTTVAMRLVNLVAGYYIFYAVSTLLTSSLEGLGKKTLTMGINIGFNYFSRFLVLIFAAMLIQGDESIAICYPVSWALCTAALGVYYFATYSKSRKYSI